jgi:hypothetical protein
MAMAEKGVVWEKRKASTGGISSKPVRQGLPQ